MWRGIVVWGGGFALGRAALFVAILWSFRTKFRPVQDTIRQVNRRVFNPRQLRSAGQPGAYASVVHHVGRRSGTDYRTPVVVVPADDDFVIGLPYGPDVDWVRNVRAAGSTTIEHEGDTIVVDRPELLPASAANRFFPAKEQRMHRLYGVDDFLLLRRAEHTGTHQTA